jgi:hypothetical protein
MQFIKLVSGGHKISLLLFPGKVFVAERFPAVPFSPVMLLRALWKSQLYIVQDGVSAKRLHENKLLFIL